MGGRDRLTSVHHSSGICDPVHSVIHSLTCHQLHEFGENRFDVFQVIIQFEHGFSHPWWDAHNIPSGSFFLTTVWPRNQDSNRTTFSFAFSVIGKPGEEWYVLTCQRTSFSEKNADFYSVEWTVYWIVFKIPRFRLITRPRILFMSKLTVFYFGYEISWTKAELSWECIEESMHHMSYPLRKFSSSEHSVVDRERTLLTLVRVTFLGVLNVLGKVTRDSGNVDKLGPQSTTPCSDTIIFHGRIRLPLGWK